MPVVAAAELETQCRERDVELVVHDHQAVERHLVEVEQPLHRAARLVHVRRRLRQHGPLALHALLGHVGTGTLVRREPTLRACGQLVEHEEAEVVPGAGVLGTGVPQPDDQPGRGVAAHGAHPRRTEPRPRTPFGPTRTGYIPPGVAVSSITSHASAVTPERRRGRIGLVGADRPLTVSTH